MDYDNESEYTWNDWVYIHKNAPQKFHPGEIGVVCGMSKIKCEEIAIEYNSKVGNWMYTVEFVNGSDVWIPSQYLEKYVEGN